MNHQYWWTKFRTNQNRTTKISSHGNVTIVQTTIPNRKLGHQKTHSVCTVDVQVAPGNLVELRQLTIQRRMTLIKYLQSILSSIKQIDAGADISVISTNTCNRLKLRYTQIEIESNDSSRNQKLLGKWNVISALLMTSMIE